MKQVAFALALATTLLATPSLPRAQAEEADAFRNDYQEGDFGRVRFQENGATLVRSQADAGGRPADAGATVNAPVFPGDTVRTSRDQRVEIQLAAGTIVRQDSDTEMSYQSLPRPGAAYQDNTVLRLASGTIRILARVGDKEDFRIDTAASSVYVLGDGDVRVDVDGRGTTRVSSFRGVVEVVGEGGSVLVRGGMRTTVEPGSIPSDPRAFNTFATDGFDLWCDRRDEAYRVRIGSGGVGDGGGDAYDAVPSEVRPYYGELSSSGRWVSVPTYGWVWYPYDVAPGWRPYGDGYWDYGPRGYFWVSNESWGWAPYHYGRWNWVIGFGWCWAPGRVFGGSWVSWSWGSLYVGWAPLDYWDRPAFANNLWYDYYDPTCWTFVNYDHIGGHDIHRYAVPIDRIRGDLPRMAVVTRPPRISPRSLATDPSVRERAAREAADDRSARVRPVSRDRVPDTKFRSVEERVIERSRERSRPESAASDSRPVSPAWRRPADRAGSRVGSTEGTTPKVRENSGRPRLLTTGDETAGRRPRSLPGTAAEPVRAPVKGQPEPNGSRRSGTTRENANRDTREQVRDMYQQYSRPRATDRQPTVQAPRASGPASSGSEPRATRTERTNSPPSRQQPSAGRPSSPPSRPQQSAERPRSTPSAPASRGGQSAPSSRPQEKEKKK